MSGGVEPRWQRLLTPVGIAFVVVVICLPGLWVMLTAFRPNVEIMSRPPVWIPSLTLDNFRAMFGWLPEVQQGLPVGHYIRNSLIASVTSTAIAVLVGTMGGYAFARYQFRGKAALFLAFMLSRTIPGVALSLPIFIIWSRLGLIDTSAGLILVYLALNIPFTVWLTDGFFRQIPAELSQAALIDGATRWQAFWHVEFPLAGAGLASAAIFAFLTSWNEFALASQLTRSVASKTLTVGLMDYTSQFTIDWVGMCAMALLIIVPAFVLTFAVQRHLIEGLTFGGVKG
ncbi:MAG TPA: carbohydrate ABC transporter permease [Bradyrhizobium sp.]